MLRLAERTPCVLAEFECDPFVGEAAPDRFRVLIEATCYNQERRVAPSPAEVWQPLTTLELMPPVMVADLRRDPAVRGLGELRKPHLGAGGLYTWWNEFGEADGAPSSGGALEGGHEHDWRHDSDAVAMRLLMDLYDRNQPIGPFVLQARPKYQSRRANHQPSNPAAADTKSTAQLKPKSS